MSHSSSSRRSKGGRTLLRNERLHVGAAHDRARAEHEAGVSAGDVREGLDLLVAEQVLLHGLFCEGVFG